MSANLFIENKYTRTYKKIVSNAQSRTPLDTYTEMHHIIPKSLGGTNDSSNLVALTAREHYICHLLLPKMLEGENKYKMLCAIMRMAHSSQEQRVKIPSRVYEHIKKEKADMHSKLFTGERNPFYGRTHSEETKQKLREARSRQVEQQGTTMTNEARAKLSKAAKGRVLDSTHKDKISKANKIIWENEKLRESVGERFRGVPKSEDHKQKLRESCLRKANRNPKPIVICPHCGKKGGEPSMKRWHMHNCKLNTKRTKG